MNFDLIGADKQIPGVRTVAQEHRVRAPQIPCCNMLQFPEACVEKKKKKSKENHESRQIKYIGDTRQADYSQVEEISAAGPR